MGTRHLIAVQSDGEYKIAQYGQWDGYPSGQGVSVLDFLRKTDLAAFREQLRKLRWATEDEVKAAWVEAGADPDSNMVSFDISERLKAAHPEVSRDTGADVLSIVNDAPDPGKLLMQNQIEFAHDSLFCEYAYVIDFDAGTFEVFKGFTHTAVTEGRFVGPLDRDYGPVQLWKSWPLDALPTEEEFLAACNEDEDDED